MPICGCKIVKIVMLQSPRYGFCKRHMPMRMPSRTVVYIVTYSFYLGTSWSCYYNWKNYNILFEAKFCQFWSSIPIKLNDWGILETH